MDVNTQIKRLAALLAAGAVAGFAGYGTAVAQADPYEPNDTQVTAYGPLAEFTQYTGTIDTSNDQDWFVFYIKDRQQVTFSANGTPGPILEVIAPNGSHILIRSAASNVNYAVTLDRGAYYIEFLCRRGGSTYSFSIVAAEPLSNRECLQSQDSQAGAHALVATATSAVARAKATVTRDTRTAQRIKTQLRKDARRPARACRDRHDLAVANARLASAGRQLASAKRSRLN
jgi:hypothetical protein